MSEFLANLHARARKGDEEPRRILFPEAADERIVKAALDLQNDGLVEPIMVVDADTRATSHAGLKRVEIHEPKALALEELLLSLRAHKKGSEDELTPQKAHELARDPLIYGMYLLRLGEADGLVAGAVRTSADVIRAGKWLVGMQEGIQSVSSSFYMVVPPFRGGSKEEVLTFADCGVIPHPTAEQLADIAIAAADARRFVVGDEPHVALLSFSTHGSGGDKSPSIQKIRTALDLIRKKRPDIKVEGELQADAALIASVSERKLKKGSAIGHGKANVLVFPDLDSGNIAYKLVERLAGAKAIGPVLQGLAKPVNDLSRGASAEDIKHSAAIAALQAK